MTSYGAVAVFREPKQGLQEVLALPREPEQAHGPQDRELLHLPTCNQMLSHASHSFLLALSLPFPLFFIVSMSMVIISYNQRPRRHVVGRHRATEGHHEGHDDGHHPDLADHQHHEGGVEAEPEVLQRVALPAEPQ